MRFCFFFAVPRFPRSRGLFDLLIICLLHTIYRHTLHNIFRTYLGLIQTREREWYLEAASERLQNVNCTLIYHFYKYQAWCCATSSSLFVRDRSHFPRRWWRQTIRENVTRLQMILHLRVIFPNVIRCMSTVALIVDVCSSLLLNKLLWF